MTAPTIGREGRWAFLAPNMTIVCTIGQLAWMDSTAWHLLNDSGYDPADRAELVLEMAQAMAEAAVDAAYDVMREHGLKPETDPTAPVWTLAEVAP